MEIIPVVPRGYCQGVIRAIQIAKKTALQYPDIPKTMLGMIVHNRFVVEECTKMGIQCVDDPKKTRLELLDMIPEGVVIITAHGVSDAVYKKIEEKGLILVDATCPDVKRTHDLVRKHTKHGGHVLYIGQKNHPEAEGTIGISPNIHLITSFQDVDLLPDLENVLITCQTTLNMNESKYLIQKCMERFPLAKLAHEICNATRIRQEAVYYLEGIDLLFVVGDPHSNNTNQLCKIGRTALIPNIYRIESAKDIKEEMLLNAKKVAVTSGSSTPNEITKKVIETLQNYAIKGKLIPLE